MGSAVSFLALATVLAALVPAAAPSPVLPGDTDNATADTCGSTPDADTIGCWSEPFDGAVPAVNLVVLEDGRLLYWSGVEAGDRDHVFLLDTPLTGTSRLLAPPYDAASVSVPVNADGGASDLFCTGQTILPDGRVLAAGGSEWRTLDEGRGGFVDGTPHARVFDPGDSAWRRVDDMAVGRWYPTVLTLPDGRALAASGIQQLPQPQTHQTLLETYASDGWRTLEGGDRLLPLYPRLFTVPSGALAGQVYYETVGTLWGPFGAHPAEATWSLAQTYDPEANAWTTLGPSVFGARQHAASVMLPLDPREGYAARILTFGGTLQRSVVATSAAEIATLGADGVARAIAAPLAAPRWHANGVILPDGNVLAVGGGLYDNVVAHGQPVVPVHDAEIYDPAADVWRTVASARVARMYHSTAALLPDGRVIAGGHVPLPVPWKDVRETVPRERQVAETRFEIYSPPYVFWPERPTIGNVTAEVAYGGAISIETPDAAAIADAILVRPAATTHAWDSNQRAVVLEILERGEGSVTLAAPAQPDVAPPGPWMVFVRTLVDGKGFAPSEGRFLRLG